MPLLVSTNINDMIMIESVRHIENSAALPNTQHEFDRAVDQKTKHETLDTQNIFRKSFSKYTLNETQKDIDSKYRPLATKLSAQLGHHIPHSIHPDSDSYWIHAGIAENNASFKLAKKKNDGNLQRNLDNSAIHLFSLGVEHLDREVKLGQFAIAFAPNQKFDNPTLQRAHDTALHRQEIHRIYKRLHNRFE